MKTGAVEWSVTPGSWDGGICASPTAEGEFVLPIPKSRPDKALGAPIPGGSIRIASGTVREPTSLTFPQRSRFVEPIARTDGVVRSRPSASGNGMHSTIAPGVRITPGGRVSRNAGGLLRSRVFDSREAITNAGFRRSLAASCACGSHPPTSGRWCRCRVGRRWRVRGRGLNWMSRNRRRGQTS